MTIGRLLVILVWMLLLLGMPTFWLLVAAVVAGLTPLAAVALVDI
jgi:hypothetical protein